MCGLGAFARIDGRDLDPAADRVLEAMADILRHRGPDDRSLLRDGPVGLAFTRLSLVDPNDGSQPLISPDGDLVLIANGEVYNHRQLAAGLRSGARFRTGSDCEVLLHLYQEKGLDFLRDVRGMFAIVLWDRKRGRLILARDRFGIKPLYYHRNAERIILSSEIKGLFADAATPRRFSWAEALAVPALAAASRYGLPEPCTWFDEVESVPAATIMNIDLRDGSTTRHQYWSLPTELDELATEDDLVERYGALLEESVTECATADTELGLFLSGGIDSAAVLEIARGTAKDIHTFTALTGGTRANGDAASSAWLAGELDVPHHQVLFGSDDVPTPMQWRRLLWLTETPMTGPEVYYKHELHRYARAVRPELRGMLLGAASDEFNGGYSTSFADTWDGFHRCLVEMRGNTRADTHPALRYWADGGGSLLVEGAFFDAVEATRAGVYGEYLRSEYHKVQQYNVWHEDRTAAGSGVEARVPFLDHRLVEVAASVPERLRPRLLWDKQIMRRAMAPRLPERIAQRPKVAFFYGDGTNHAYQMLVRLMRADGGELVERATSAPGAGDFLDGEAVRERLRSFGNGDTDAGGVELLLRVVNMGLLAELAEEVPTLEAMDAGPVPAALEPGRDPVSATAAMFGDGRRFDVDRRPRLADGTLLLWNEEGECHLLRDGEIEFVFDKESPVPGILATLDGHSEDGVLPSSSLEEVREELDILVREQMIVLADLQMNGDRR